MQRARKALLRCQVSTPGVSPGRPRKCAQSRWRPHSEPAASSTPTSSNRAGRLRAKIDQATVADQIGFAYGTTRANQMAMARSAFGADVSYGLSVSGSMDMRTIGRSWMADAISCNPHKEEDEGFLAAEAGRRLSDNPYPSGTIRYSEWRRGWQIGRAAGRQEENDGYLAAEDGQSLAENPHPPGTIRYDHWRRGWQRKSDETQRAVRLGRE
jgi:hypothetical protein